MKLNAFIKTVRPVGGWLPPKIILAMKITTFLLFAILVQVSAKSYSQINLNENNAPLAKILNSIKRQTGYSFFYDTEDVKEARVSIHVNNVSLDQALSICFKDLPISFKVIENNVVLKKEEPSLIEKITTMLSPAKDVTGFVFDEGGPLPGVSVRVKGTNNATSTNDQGIFTLPNLKEGDILVFTYVGYKTQEVFIKGGSAGIRVRMEKDVAGLQDVVVVGYGSTQRKDLTGAVSTVNVADIQDVPFATIDNALAGKAAGVQVTKSDGSPGGAVRIRVRGSSSILGGNDPLYVIDGIPVQVSSSFQAPGYDVSSPVGNDVTASGGVSTGLSTSFVNGLNSLGGLNIDDIESITILKDASSTAIYGSKAANGVVIITTKKGKKDMKPVISASYYSTVSTPITPTVLNAEQYRTLITEAAQNDKDSRVAAGKTTFPANTTAILNNPSSFFGTANTDWIKEVTRNTVSHNAEVSVQGGGNSSKYFSSISYNTTPGVVKNTDYHRISGKINLENEIGPKFRFITNLILGYVNQNIGDGAFDQALKARPDYSPYDANGNFADFSNVGYSYLGFQNPVALLQATNNSKTFSLFGTVSGVYDITKDLQFKSSLSLNSQTYNQRNFTPSYIAIGSFYGSVDNDGGIGSNSNWRHTNWIFENTLSYNKKFDQNNNLNVLAGQSYETRKASFFSATATGYPNDNVLTSLSSAVTPLYVYGDDPSVPQSYLLSFYLRANYSLMDKYLLTFTGRTDGSSKLGPGHKYSYFPSGAAAWRVSQENFLKNVKWIDDIKIRGSYGLTGTQSIDDQMYRTLYSPLSYGGVSALVPTQLGNKDIKWETTREADGGLDISLFNSRLTATFDYYNRQTSGDLLSLPVAPSSSYSRLLSNAVGIKNTGVEFSLDGDIIRTRDFKWNAGFNVTWNNSVVTKLSSSADLTQIGDLTGMEYGNTTLVQGKPLGLITGITITGIIKTKAQLDDYKKQLGGYAAYFPYLAIGDPMYQLEDEGGGYHYPNFNTIIGNAAPKYYGGITQGFTYKNFDLQFYFTFSQGGKLLWGDHVSSVEFVGSSNANISMLNRYTPTNTNTNQPRLVLNNDDGFYYKTQQDLFNSSYLKLRTLTFNYHFDKKEWMKKAGFSSVAIFASATNLFTITKYPGNDPETSDDPYSVQGGYFDVSNYPTIRAFSLGLKAGF
ncbi:SusC/RagA family TonB-linked outer membrane protein [Mucilaginibacter corticis]|uniref:SusC/RagA family TonB-linked outer membrane protein n=1 Tax=Mucilaginibacter corticis TaxID=2597670 RepID=A0A556ML74_9SPHI|nr:SusC/RagA family TonB-linked outer membrane protein [Mucilaginibacter corticis]TSJ40539.1 SusC/RagA family TonB-linked outer membrane protein [Mucilaginibacter corticis]